MQADEVGFLELFDGKVQFVVPKWQRRYCWGKADIGRLAEDLDSISRAPNQDQSHYGGSLITFSPPGQPPGVVRTERVVDGQQRMTTVSILLNCIADSMNGGECYGGWTRQDILDLLVNRGEDGSGKQRKLRLQSGDEAQYVGILRGKRTDGLVTDAWSEARQLVDRYGPERLMAGLRRFRVVSLGVEEHDDPQQIFESLNATGRPLEVSEKVKNWLLMGHSDAVQQDLYEQYWLKIEKALDANQSSRPIDLFLRDFMRWQTGKARAIEQTYQEFRRWTIEHGWQEPERRRQLFADLAHLAGLYGKLTGRSGSHPEESIEFSLRHLRAMDINTHRPLTLRLLHELTPRTGGAVSTVEETARVFEAISVWVTRLWLVNKIQALNVTCAHMAAMDPVNSEAYSDQWINRIRALHRQDVGVPSDASVADGIRTRGVYRSKSTRLAVLCALMEAEQGDEAPDRGTLCTERVMPRLLTESWRRVLGPEAEETHAAWRYRLANLALVGDLENEVGEHQPFGKKMMAYQKSQIGLTRRLSDGTGWNESKLERISRDLAERAIEVWPWDPGPDQPQPPNGKIFTWCIGDGPWRRETIASQMVLNVVGALLSKDPTNAEKLSGEAISSNIHSASRFPPGTRAGALMMRAVPGHVEYVLYPYRGIFRKSADFCVAMGERCGVTVKVRVDN